VQGISLTALKNACRQVGINNWPYPRSKKEEEESQDSTADLFFMRDAMHVPAMLPALVRREEFAGHPYALPLKRTAEEPAGSAKERSKERAKRLRNEREERSGQLEEAQVEREWGRGIAAEMEEEEDEEDDGRELGKLWHFRSGRRINDMQILSLLDDAFSCVVD